MQKHFVPMPEGKVHSKLPSVKAETAGTAAPYFLEAMENTACPISVLPLPCLKKSHKNNTSLRPFRHTSCLPQSTLPHLHTFTRSAFTLIELLVITSPFCRFIKHTVFAQAKTYSLFLKRDRGLGKGENLFSREKKFSPSPGTIYPCREPRVVFYLYRQYGLFSDKILRIQKKTRGQGKIPRPPCGKTCDFIPLPHRSP